MRFTIFLLCLLATWHALAQSRPNIIFIVADDMGYADAGCYGNTAFATPAIDALAARGTRFTQAYSCAPVCTPSRTGFITGRWPARSQVGLREPLTTLQPDSLIGITPDLAPLPLLLKEAGYTTHLVGKWHLGYGPMFSPGFNGFDSFYGYKNGGVDYASHTTSAGKPDWYRNEDLVQDTGYATHLLTREAIRIVQQPHSKPFFLSLQYSAPHWPWQAPGDTPYARNSDFTQGGSAHTYRAMMESMDAGIGALLAELDRLNLAGNTLIVFTSDNGGEKYSNMGGLKQQKFVLWEGGIRVPAILCWPGQVAAGKVSVQPIINLDFTATFLAAAQAKPRYGLPPDGANLLPLLAKDKVTPRTFYWRVFQRNQQKALRQGNWKYLKTEDSEYLFDLATDPSEDKDLKAVQPRRFNELKEQYAAWEATVLQPVPLPGKK